MVYKDFYNDSITLLPIYDNVLGFDSSFAPIGVSDVMLTKNFSLLECFNASYVLDSEKKSFDFLPLDLRLLDLAQYLRDYLNTPLHIGSLFRSVAWELFRKRSGTSKHCDGLAIDLNGEGLVSLIKEALTTKNKLYDYLISVGVRGIGVYEELNFIHFDFRLSKNLVLWSDGFTVKKKKN
jgi:uncharacterized protein YcbK (DUF882 family)